MVSKDKSLHIKTKSVAEKQRILDRHSESSSAGTRLTFDGDAGGYRGLPPPLATPGDTGLDDVVPGLAEEMDGALLGEASTRRRITAESPMFRHQRVGAVAQSACRNTEHRDESSGTGIASLFYSRCGNYS